MILQHILKRNHKMNQKDILLIQSIFNSNYTDPYSDYGANLMWHQLLEDFIDNVKGTQYVHDLHILKIHKEKKEKP